MDSFLKVLCPDYVVEEITVGEQMVVVKAHRIRHIAVCPDCGQESGRIHSYYDRKPQDLPIGGCYVRLSLTTRRFRCLNEQCKRRIFAESWGDWLYRYVHKTSRMKDTLYHVAQAAGGQGGARILQQLKLVASGITLIRLLRAQIIPQITTTSVIGIDDWAIRHGRTYGSNSKCKTCDQKQIALYHHQNPKKGQCDGKKSASESVYSTSGRVGR